ncbi:MAG TPA: MATE family efflux transporter, partial [Polyangia bacterium]
MTPPPNEEVESLPVLVGSPGNERFWSLVRESLAGSRRDLTVMPLGRAILLLAIPMVLEMVMESVFAVADIFWVSKLGADAVATVGLTESLLSIVYAISMGLAMGVGAVVARRTGAKDARGAGRAAVQAVLLGLGLAVVVGTVGGFLAPRLLALLGASPAVLATGTGFARIMLSGCATIVLLFMINAAFRGAGDASITLRTLWLANGINILLGPILVFGLGPAPRLGVNGAALATNIGRGVGVLYQLWMLSRGGGRLVIRREHLTFDSETLRTIFRIARSGVVQMMIGMTSWIGLVRILAAFGSSALAGYTIAMRVVMFMLLPSWGLGNA